MSHFALYSPVTGKEIRQELVFMMRTAFGDRNIPALLYDFGQEAINQSRAFLRGEVIGPRGKLFPGTESNLEAFFVYGPVYLPDAFSIFKLPKGGDGIIAWLIPITFQEAEFVKMQGWKGFETLLLQADPDLLDLNRACIVPGE